MPVVPITSARRTPNGKPVAPPLEPFTLMALAQMHAEGKLPDAPTGPASGSASNPAQ